MNNNAQGISRELFCPALLGLLRTQTAGKLARCFSSFRTPRKRVVAYLCIGLAVLWLVNVLAALLLRPAANFDRLMIWIPSSLLGYSVWHLIKTVARKPTIPFDWTPAEDEFVRTAPISRTQLISYRLTSIFSAGILKALCFSIVMVPDLKFWAAGFIGMFLGLVFVDLFRVCVELFFHGLSRRWQRVMKTVVLGTAIVIGVKLFVTCIAAPEAASRLDSPASLGFIQSLFAEILSLANTTIGGMLLIPFTAFAKLMFVDSISVNSAMHLTSAVLLVYVMSFAVFGLDRWASNQTKVRAKTDFKNALANRNDQTAEEPTRFKLHTSQISNLLKPRSGMSAIAWRQLLGAWHFRATLAVSLGFPVILCCLPLLKPQEPLRMLMQVVGALVFYSFVLLPAALILDFRRDINRMFVLKALPLSPLKITLGQLATPVLLCTLFQSTVLSIAVLVGSVVAWQALVAGLLLVPINVLIFALENYIFLLAPYQRKKKASTYS